MIYVYLCDLFFFLCACLWHSWSMPIMYSIARLKPMFSGWEPPPGLGMRCLVEWSEVPAVEMHVLNTWKVMKLCRCHMLHYQMSSYVIISCHMSSYAIICYHTFIHGKRDFESYGFPIVLWGGEHCLTSNVTAPGVDLRLQSIDSAGNGVKSQQPLRVVSSHGWYPQNHQSSSHFDRNKMGKWFNVLINRGIWV